MKINFDIELFFKQGYFVNKTASDLEMIQQNCDSSFGDEHKMYFFYFKGFTVSFIHHIDLNYIEFQQIEIGLRDQLENSFLEKIVTLNRFTRFFEIQIDSIYADDYDEKVIFLNNGIIAHFLDDTLSKVTTASKETRAFVEKFMKEIAI